MAKKWPFSPKFNRPPPPHHDHKNYVEIVNKNYWFKKKWRKCDYKVKIGGPPLLKSAKILGAQLQLINDYPQLVTVSAEGRVENQKLNKTAALLSFGWVFGFQLDLLEKNLVCISEYTCT